VTTETPWLTERSDKDLPNVDRDTLASLGFGFTEESPTIISGAAGSAVRSALVSLPVTDSLPATVATDLAPISRRSLRDAERAVPSSRLPERLTKAVPRPPGRAARRGNSVVAVTAASTTGIATAVAATKATSRVPFARRIAKRAFPPVVMLAAASLLVGTSVPANALFDPSTPPSSMAMSSVPAEKVEVVELEDQVIEAEAANELASTAAARDEWGVTSYAEMLRLRYGSNSFLYTTSGSGAIRWPFPFAAAISSGFGDRAAPCRGCSSFHRGLDFIAGYGAPIGAVADGIVTAVGRSSAYGYRVEIDHVINGQKVTTLYAHMIDNSSVLQVGAPVVAGEIVGALGNTGLSTGPHLHLEILLDGVQVDPFAWLTANAS